MYRLIARKLGLALLIAAPLSSHALEPDKLFEKLSPSVWSVVASDGSQKPFSWGSAVVIGPGRLVTNCHVLKKAKSVLIKKDNIAYGASLEFADPERDLCQLKVANFNAPAVIIGATQKLRVGQKVFAIGNPLGLELTLSEGLISSLRQFNESDLPRIQTTAPISNGSSGGGLFDSDGRLIGITTSGRDDGQNINFAHPASWIAEIETRHKASMAKLEASKNAAIAPQAASINYSGPLRINETFVYQVTDRFTRLKRTVTHRIDKIDGNEDRVTFNQGARIENTSGKVVKISTFDLGAFDTAMPPGGWVNLPLTPGKTWQESYASAMNQSTSYNMSTVYKLTAKVIGDETIVILAGEFTATRVEWRGYANHAVLTNKLESQSYKATVWYSPELNRIVKFTVESMGGRSSLYEILELASYTVK